MAEGYLGGSTIVRIPARFLRKPICEKSNSSPSDADGEQEQRRRRASIARAALRAAERAEKEERRRKRREEQQEEVRAAKRRQSKRYAPGQTPTERKVADKMALVTVVRTGQGNDG